MSMIQPFSLAGAQAEKSARPPGRSILRILVKAAAKSLKNMRSHKRSVSGQEHTIDTLIEQGIIMCGSPDTVRRQFMDTHRLLGFQNLLCLMQFATLPRDLTEKNISLFAAEVLPRLRPVWDAEGWENHWWPRAAAVEGAV